MRERGLSATHKEERCYSAELSLTAANGISMLYLRWIDTVSFYLISRTEPPEKMISPMLVMKGCYLSYPIIGYNVIDYILNKTEKAQIYSTVRKAFSSLKRNKVKAFIQAVNADTVDVFEVKTKKDCITVPSQSHIQVECRVAPQPQDMTMLFEPDLNP